MHQWLSGDYSFLKLDVLEVSERKLPFVRDKEGAMGEPTLAIL